MLKKTWLLTLLTLIALLVAACGAVPGGAGPNTGAAPAEPADDGDEQVTITFWHHWGGNRVPLMEEQIRRFEEKYPNIKVEMTLQPWDNRLQKILTTVAAGDPPDVTMLGKQDLPAFVEQDALVAIDSFMERDGITPDVYYPSEIAGAVYKGETWLLPLPTGGALDLFWYNKQMFRDAGLDPDNPPQTWAELEEVGKKLAVVEDGSLKRVGLRVSGNARNFFTWLGSNGGEWISEDLRTVTINTPEGLETIEFIVNFTNDINQGREEQDAFYAQTGEWENGPFYNDFEAMQVNGSWEYFKIAEYAPDYIDPEILGITAVPYGPSGNENERGAAYGGWGYVIPKNVSHPEEAWLLLKFLTADKDGGCWFLQQQQRPSPWIECNEDPESGAENFLWNDILETMSKDKLVRISPVQPQIEEVMTQMIDEAQFGLRTPQEALEWAQEESQRILDEFWAEKDATQ